MLLALHPMTGRPRGDGWARCLEQRPAIERWLGEGLDRVDQRATAAATAGSVSQGLRLIDRRIGTAATCLALTHLPGFFGKRI